MRVIVAYALLAVLCGRLWGETRRAAPADVRALRQYVKTGWKALRRDVRTMSPDGKLGKKPGDSMTLYVSRKEDLAAVKRRIQRPGVEVRRLPTNPLAITKHGMVYVPEPYVVPGGRFDEIYGWDSYFIHRGLLGDRHVKLSRSMTNNLLYEVRHYGKVLNANRTWSLGRSHPPFLTRMILEVYERTGDRAWVTSTLDAVETYHGFWTSGKRFTAKTGLSRYWDDDRGKAPEVAFAGEGEYERTLAEFRARARADEPGISRYYDATRDRLTSHFMRGNRAVRESGNDTTDRFGPAGGDTHDYNPVDLNSLLYKMEVDAARIARIAGRPEDAARFRARAAERKKAIDRHLWDPERGMYFDYHVPSGRRSDRVFASTFFPLWAKAASKEQARRVVANLHLLEAPGGLLTSNRVTGHQWDAPFGWAPLVAIAVTGLRNYGYDREANRISVNFLSMVLKEFKATGHMAEKYDVVHRDANVSRALRFGYTTNEIGFGWTNGVFVDLYRALPPSERTKVQRPSGVPLPGEP